MPERVPLDPDEIATGAGLIGFNVVATDAVAYVDGDVRVLECAIGLNEYQFIAGKANLTLTTFLPTDMLL